MAKQPSSARFGVGIFKRDLSLASNIAPTLRELRHDIAMKIAINTLLSAYLSFNADGLCCRNCLTCLSCSLRRLTVGKDQHCEDKREGGA
jgi:hypothetical protein